MEEVSVAQLGPVPPQHQLTDAPSRSPLQPGIQGIFSIHLPAHHYQPNHFRKLTITGDSRNLSVMVSSYSLSVTVKCWCGRGMNEDDQSRIDMDGGYGLGVTLRRLVSGAGRQARRPAPRKQANHHRSVGPVESGGRETGSETHGTKPRSRRCACPRTVV